jgi:hypothetical protein
MKNQSRMNRIENCPKVGFYLPKGIWGGSKIKNLESNDAFEIYKKSCRMKLINNYLCIKLLTFRIGLVAGGGFETCLLERMPI